MVLAARVLEVLLKVASAFALVLVLEREVEVRREKEVLSLWVLVSERHKAYASLSTLLASAPVFEVLALEV